MPKYKPGDKIIILPEHRKYPIRASRLCDNNDLDHGVVEISPDQVFGVEIGNEDLELSQDGFDIISVLWLLPYHGNLPKCTFQLPSYCVMPASKAARILYL